MGSASSGKPNSKVARVIDEYDLSGWGDRLEDEWVGDDGERTSLRDLAELFNRAVLAAALREAGEAIIEDDLDSTYRVLTGAGVSQADTLRKERELERLGLDVDDVRSDFVTHQAIHTYLTTYREVELERSERSPEERREKELETILRLQSRTTAVTQDAVERLAAGGVLELGDADVFVDVRVFCEECGGDFTVNELLRRGSCHCR